MQFAGEDTESDVDMVDVEDSDIKPVSPHAPHDHESDIKPAPQQALHGHEDCGTKENVDNHTCEQQVSEDTQCNELAATMRTQPLEAALPLSNKQYVGSKTVLSSKVFVGDTVMILEEASQGLQASVQGLVGDDGLVCMVLKTQQRRLLKRWQVQLENSRPIEVPNMSVDAMMLLRKLGRGQGKAPSQASARQATRPFAASTTEKTDGVAIANPSKSGRASASVLRAIPPRQAISQQLPSFHRGGRWQQEPSTFDQIGQLIAKEQVRRKRETHELAATHVSELHSLGGPQDEHTVLVTPPRRETRRSRGKEILDDGRAETDGVAANGGPILACYSSGPDQPKKPASAYFMWFSENRASIAESLGQTSMGEVAKAAGVRWKAMPAVDKAIYKERAKKTMEDYHVALQNFKNAGGVIQKIVQKRRPAPEMNGIEDHDTGKPENEQLQVPAMPRRGRGEGNAQQKAMRGSDARGPRSGRSLKNPTLKRLYDATEKPMMSALSGPTRTRARLENIVAERK